MIGHLDVTFKALTIFITKFHLSHPHVAVQSAAVVSAARHQFMLPVLVFLSY